MGGSASVKLFFPVPFRGETGGRLDPTVPELNKSIPLGKQKCDRGDERVCQMDRAIFTVHSIYMIAGFRIKQPCERLAQISTATAPSALRCGFTCWSIRPRLFLLGNQPVTVARKAARSCRSIDGSTAIGLN